MQTYDHRLRTKALIEAIWGTPAELPAPAADPEMRTQQNEALANAIRDYLQQYLIDADALGDDGLIKPDH